MKKIAVLLLLVLSLAGCGNKTQPFIVENLSDWRIVVAVTNYEEVGRKTNFSLYVIGKLHEWRLTNLLNSAVFHLYPTGDCSLLSVNGAKIKEKTLNKLVLENATPIVVNVINKTGKDVIIKNEPCLADYPIDEIYSGRYKDFTGKLRSDYMPLFAEQVISKDAISSNPKKINCYAWQLSEIEEENEFENFAEKHILITVNGISKKTQWKLSDNTISLYILP